MTFGGEMKTEKEQRIEGSEPETWMIPLVARELKVWGLFQERLLLGWLARWLGMHVMFLGHVFPKNLPPKEVVQIHSLLEPMHSQNSLAKLLLLLHQVGFEPAVYVMKKGG